MSHDGYFDQAYIERRCAQCGDWLDSPMEIPGTVNPEMFVCGTECLLLYAGQYGICAVCGQPDDTLLRADPICQECRE